MKNLSPDELNILLRQYIDHVLADDRHLRLEPKPFSIPPEISPWEQDRIDAYIDAHGEWKGLKAPRRLLMVEHASSARVEGKIEPIAEEVLPFLERLGMEVDPESMPFKTFCYEVAGLISGLVDLLKWRDQGLEYEPEEVFPKLYSAAPLMQQQGGARPGPVVPTQPEGLGSTLGELREAFLMDCEHLAQNSIVGYTSNTGAFVEIVGRDVCIGELSVSHMKDYWDVMKRLPKDALKERKKKYAGQQLNVISKRNYPVEMRYRKGGLEAHKRMVRRFLNWIAEETEEPIGSVMPLIKKLKMPKDRAGTKKKVGNFQPSDLKAIFDYSGFHPGMGQEFTKSYQYWVPLIGLLTGARVSEICQLELDDIKDDDGTWVFDIQIKGKRSAKEEDTTPRIIPVHPVLLTLGLIKRVERLKTVKTLKNRQLFPKLNITKSKEKYGGNVSSWFNDKDRFPKLCGYEKEDPVTGERKSFHSFRHTLRTDMEVRWRIDSININAYLGHAQEGRAAGTSGYRHSWRDNKDMLEKVVKRIDYSDIIDFDSMKGSKWVEIP